MICGTGGLLKKICISFSENVVVSGSELFQNVVCSGCGAKETLCGRNVVYKSAFFKILDV